MFIVANVAQSVERRHGKAKVNGSIPFIGSPKYNDCIFLEVAYTFGHANSVT